MSDRHRLDGGLDSIVVLGSDIRLQSQYGTRSGHGLRISEIPGPGYRILYGPHLSLSAGHYRFELMFDMEARGEGNVTVDLSHSGGHRDFYMRRCFEWELKRGVIRISYHLRQAIDAFELRLYAGTGFELLVKQLAIGRIS